MPSNIHVALDNNGTLEWKVVAFGPSLTGYESNLMSPKPIVGLWVQRELGGNDFWDEWTGNSAYSLVEGPDDFVVKSFDDGGQGTTRVKEYFKDGNAGTIRTAEGGAALLGGGATWDVLDNGSGNSYDGLVEDAKAHIASTYGAPY